MHILAVDDEFLALEVISDAIRQASPTADLHAFQDTEEALAFAKETPPDVAFLDIDLRGDNGVSFAKKLIALYPRVNIIFATGYAHYMKDAFSLYASGYVLKPVTAEQIKGELAHLRYMPDTASSAENAKKRIFVRTFGNFEVYGDGEPLAFKYQKTRELLALLIDVHGEPRSMEDLRSSLWEQGDFAHSSYLRNLISDLRRTLKQYQADDAIVKRHNAISVNKSKIDCDFFDYLARKDEALDAFDGEYMTQYSWAEQTLGAILNGRL